MTVSSTTARVSYAGDGVTATFTVPFYFLASGDLQVIRRSSAGVETVLALSTGYTVSGAGSPSGGSVTVLAGSIPASGETLTVLRNVPLTQLTDYQANDPFPAASHETALDKLTMTAQQLQEQISRAVKVNPTDTVTPDQLLSSINTSTATCVSSAAAVSAAWTAFQGQYYGSLASDPAVDPLGAACGAGDLYFNSSTARLRVYSGVAWADVGVASPVSVTQQQFSGTGVQTAFTLSATPAFQAACWVYISGVAQVAGVDYTVAGTTLTFTTAPPAGTNNIFVRLVSAFSIGVPNDASVTPAKMAASGNEFGFRNKLINGDFRINQRGVSGTVTLAAGAYGHDRWKAGASGCTYTYFIAQNITTLTITAGTLQQVIEGASLRSGVHKLSWTGTAQGRVDAGVYGASGLSGTAVGGTNQTIEFGTGTLASVQYEYGVVTPFELRPYGLELSLCQRYYEMLAIVHANSPSTQYQSASWRQVKRGIPTLSVVQVSGSGVGAIGTDPVTGTFGVYQSSAPTGIGTVNVAGSAEL